MGRICFSNVTSRLSPLKRGEKTSAKEDKYDRLGFRLGL